MQGFVAGAAFGLSLAVVIAATVGASAKNKALQSGKTRAYFADMVLDKGESVEHQFADDGTKTTVTVSALPNRKVTCTFWHYDVYTDGSTKKRVDSKQTGLSCTHAFKDVGSEYLGISCLDSNNGPCIYEVTSD